MSLFMDLKVREQSGAKAVVPQSSRSTVTAANSSSFSQVLAATYQAGGGENYENYFQAASEAYQVPVNLLKAVAKVESDFRPNAVSHCGAQGVMQLMPATARSLGVTDAFDPAQNIMGGAKYIRQMLDRFDGDVSKALAAYNAGPGAVKKYGGPPPYTQSYVNKVLGYAGTNLSVPTQAVSTATASTPAAISAVPQTTEQDGTLTFNDSLSAQLYSSDRTHQQAVARLLLQQLLLKSEQEEEEKERSL